MIWNGCMSIVWDILVIKMITSEMVKTKDNCEILWIPKKVHVKVTNGSFQKWNVYSKWKIKRFGNCNKIQRVKISNRNRKTFLISRFLKFHEFLCFLDFLSHLRNCCQVKGNLAIWRLQKIIRRQQDGKGEGESLSLFAIKWQKWQIQRT